MSSRAEILRRVRAALADRPAVEPVPRDYVGAGAERGVAGLDLFVERAADYQARVRVVAEQDVAKVVGASVHGVLVAPEDIPAHWLPGAVAIRLDRGEISVDGLDAAGAVLTACAVAIADTGTVVLDHSAAQGRRALTLVPDHHIVVVQAEQIVAAVPDAIAWLDPVRPQTWISGPSATSDIELSRVEGVHGPRRLDIVVIATPADVTNP